MRLVAPARHDAVSHTAENPAAGCLSSATEDSCPLWRIEDESLLFLGDGWAQECHDVELQDEAGRRLDKAKLAQGIAGMTRKPAMIGEPVDADAGPVRGGGPGSKPIVDRGSGAGRPGLPGESDQPAARGPVLADRSQLGVVRATPPTHTDHGRTTDGPQDRQPSFQRIVGLLTTGLTGAGGS